MPPRQLTYIFDPAGNRVNMIEILVKSEVFHDFLSKFMCWFGEPDSPSKYLCRSGETMSQYQSLDLECMFCCAVQGSI